MKKHSTLFIGLDTHKDSIAVAYATDSRAKPVTYLGAIGTQHYAIRKMVRQLEARHPGCQLQFVYEADFTWQYLFPSSSKCVHPYDGYVCRHPLHHSAFSKQLREAVLASGVQKRVDRTYFQACLCNGAS
jgi:hypothetical protein